MASTAKYMAEATISRVPPRRAQSRDRIAIPPVNYEMATLSRALSESCGSMKLTGDPHFFLIWNWRLCVRRDRFQCPQMWRAPRFLCVFIGPQGLKVGKTDPVRGETGTEYGPARRRGLTPSEKTRRLWPPRFGGPRVRK